jgi:hypothetical protein
MAMKDRRRLSDGKLSRDAVDTGTAEAVAFGTMAAGLVIGTMEQLAPAWSVTARYGHGVDPASSAAGNGSAAIPAAEAVQVAHADVATLDHAAPFREMAHQADLQPQAPAEPGHEEAAGDSPSGSSATATPAHDLSPEPVGDATAAAASGPAHGDAERPAASAEPAPLTTAPEAAIAGIAQHISEAMDTLVDQMKALPTGIEGISSLVQHATDIGAIAGQMVNEISSAALKGVEGLSEVLGGPPLDLGTISAPLDLPASILGAATDGVGAGHGGDAVLPILNVGPPLEPAHADTAMPVVDHVAGPALELPPLQLGFLGQSYTDVVDHHDNGSHSLNSPLHGFI